QFMNGIRAYFDRIQGRLLAALAPGALAILVLFIVSTTTSRRFSATLASELEAFQERINLAARLESAISDQLASTQQYLIDRDSASLNAALEQARAAHTLRGELATNQDLAEGARIQLESIRAELAESVESIQAAQQQLTAGNQAAALRTVRGIEGTLRGVSARIRGVTLAE